MSTTAITTDHQIENQPEEDQEVTGASVEELSTDRMFHLLQNERRRLTLEYLQGTEGVVDMREIVENVAAIEYDTQVEQLSSTERQRVYIALYQSHLPKLADSDVIEYDQSRGRVQRTELANKLDPYLANETWADESESTQPAWDRYYLSASALATVLLVGAWLNVVPTVSGFAVAGLIIAGFVGIALAHSFARS